MRSITFLSIVLSVTTLALTDVVGQSVSNLSLGTPERRGSSSSTSGTYEICTTVSGGWLGYSYNFGCLCLDDVDDYCSSNQISSGMKSLIKSQIENSGSKSWYPSNAQPTCDGSGGYTCGSLSRTSSGSCESTVCDPKKTSSNGGCCPRGQTYQDGRCCGAVGCDRGGSQCTPVLTCSTYTSNGICCPSDSSDWAGCSTVCCPKDQPEVGSTGVCCPEGSTVSSSGNCISPSGSYRRRARSLVGQQIHLGPVESSTSFGLAGNSKGDMCPGSLAACPIDGYDASQYECIDTHTDLQSCGGCSSLGQGVDCTAIAGARWMGCSKGKCEVYSCRKGWRLSANGTSCDRR